MANQSRATKTKRSLTKTVKASEYSSHARERYEQALRNWDSKLKHLSEANRESEQLNNEDFAIRINTRE